MTIDQPEVSAGPDGPWSRSSYFTFPYPAKALFSPRLALAVAVLQTLRHS